MRRIMAYDWPGNIRELENAIERAVALGSGPILHVGDLPSNLHYISGERHSDQDELVPLDALERRGDILVRTLTAGVGQREHREALAVLHASVANHRRNDVIGIGRRREDVPAFGRQDAGMT